MPVGPSSRAQALLLRTGTCRWKGGLKPPFSHAVPQYHRYSEAGGWEGPAQTELHLVGMVGWHTLKCFCNRLFSF